MNCLLFESLFAFMSHKDTNNSTIIQGYEIKYFHLIIVQNQYAYMSDYQHTGIKRKNANDEYITLLQVKNPANSSKQRCFLYLGDVCKLYDSWVNFTKSRYDFQRYLLIFNQLGVFGQTLNTAKVRLYHVQFQNLNRLY